MNKNIILILLIDLACFYGLFHMWTLYSDRQSIITSENPIMGYKIVETECHPGNKMGSNVLIEYNGRRYLVEMSAALCAQCESLDLSKVSLYYDQEREEVFEQSDMSIRHIIVWSLASFCTTIWLIHEVVKSRKGHSKIG